MTVGNEEEKGRNIILLNTNTLPNKEDLQRIMELDNIENAMALDLPLLN